MPRSKRTLHFTVVEGEPHFEIKDWTKIESAYGSDLPKPVRSEIHDITRLYLLRAQCERAAVPVSDIAKLISSVRGDTKQLQDTLLEVMRVRNGVAAAIIEGVSDDIVTAESPIATLKDAKLGALAQAEDATAYGLRCEAGKNWDGRPDDGTMSSFTAFVTAIEDEDGFPEEYRRSGTSGARTQAIHRAQRGEI